MVLKEPRPGSDLLCYVGKVSHADKGGLRITLIDWIVELPLGDDMTFRWDAIDYCVVQTEPQPLCDLASVQERVERDRVRT